MKDTSLLFAMLSESGHLNPTFRLARSLRSRGHTVRYLAAADVQATIEAQGFEVEPLFPDLFPRGVLEREQGLPLLRRRRAITTRYRAQLERLLAGAPVVRTPSLLMVDVTQVQIALWAKRAGVPFLSVNTSLPQTKDEGVPPLRSGAPYASDLRGQVRAELIWRRFVAKRNLSARLAALGGMCPPYELARRYAPRFGVNARELDSDTVYMPQLRGVPEIVLCPQAFDFPRPARAERTYVESIDLARNEPAFTWDALGEGRGFTHEQASERPLVYCALGSQRYRADVVPMFFERLVRAFRERPGLQLLLAVGKHVRPEQLPAAPNVRVVERAPQLAVLRRARVMITHGGLGSVKECIANAVPMLGVPLDVDQPGNIARVVHHGLGLAADVARARELDLLDGLDRLLREPSFRERASAMQRSFERAESGERGVSLVESLLTAQASRSRHGPV
jgi:zeaxanthin glucosyltransferase